MTISYLDVISNYYPTIQVSATGPNYEDITWSHGGPIAKNELEDKMIDLAKDKKVEELSYACERAIIGGFLSSALGSSHVYDSEEVDQINLLGAVAAASPTPDQPQGFSIYYACRDVQTGIKSYAEHSYVQLRTVLNDGSLFKLYHLQTFHTKRVQVWACQTLEEIDLISWD